MIQNRSASVRNKDACVRLNISRKSETGPQRGRAGRTRAHLPGHEWCCLGTFAYTEWLFLSTLHPPCRRSSSLPTTWGLCNFPSLQGSPASLDDQNTEPAGEPVKNPRAQDPTPGASNFIAQTGVSSIAMRTGIAQGPY